MWHYRYSINLSRVVPIIPEVYNRREAAQKVARGKKDQAIASAEACGGGDDCREGSGEGSTLGLCSLVSTDAASGGSPVAAVSCAAMRVRNLELSLWINCRYVPVSVI